jgi:hypothetical protein
MHSMVVQGVTRLKWKLVSVHLEIELILTQDRCTVSTKRTIGSVIVLDAPNGTPRWQGSCQILFRSVWKWRLCRCKIGAWFAPNLPYAQESFWTQPMVLIDDEDQVEARFCLFRDSANLDARWVVHYLRRMYHRLKNHFVRSRWNSYVMWVMSNLISVHLETALVSVQDRCMVCAKRINHFGRTRWFS